MITEDYVSFEVAKLLKEKGFDAECDYLYVDGELVRAQGCACNWNEGESLYTDYKNECSAPTLQMTMKWLREEKNIIVNIWYNGVDWDTEYYNNEDEDFYLITDTSCNSYEEACEAGIKYCLENLI